MANGNRLSRVGYHAVFAVALALVGIDILLRLMMIEQRSARKWIQPQLVAETDALIEAGSQYESSGDDAPSPSASCDAVLPESQGEPVGVKPSPLPGMVRLMCSGNLLLVFAAIVVNASFYASFDSACLVSDSLCIASDISGRKWRQFQVSDLHKALI